jgi:hypothetical protein
MKEPKIKSPTAANEEATILEILRRFPDSVGFVFRLDIEGGRYIYYMKLDDPVFLVNDTKYVTKVNVMGYHQTTRELWFTDLNIPRGVELITVTNHQLLYMLEDTAMRIKNDALPQPGVPMSTAENFKIIGLLND